jgi:hypothetical protein
MSRISTPNSLNLLAGLLAGSFIIFSASAETGAEQARVESSDMSKSSLMPAPVASPSPMATTQNWAARHGFYYKRNWGVEIIGVKPSAAGYMLTFRYRIVDPDKAKLLNDRKAKAYLIDEASGITLAVPAMENIGELRQGARPEADRNYFMVFGNPGKIVKSGSRVTVVAGNFRAEGLIVD